MRRPRLSKKDPTNGSNPQKQFMRRICNFCYYFGMGEFWYEHENKFPLNNWYKIWMAISNLYSFFFVINEYLALFRSDLDDKEKNDLMQFTLGHSSIMAKIICAYWEQKRIPKVFERILEGSRSVFVSEKLDKACIKQCFRLCVVIIVVLCLALIVFTVDGIRPYIMEGVPIRTEVAFYPPPSDSGFLVSVFRFLIQFHWWFIVTIMTFIDCLCICSLVIMSYKFKVIQVYFNSIRQKTLRNVGKKSTQALAEEFRDNFVVGIKLHEDALWCAKHVQSTMGNLYSVQVLETIVLLVINLIKLVKVKRNLIFLLANFIYIASTILLTGAYMMPAGDITHEASLVSTAIFHCGWELVPSRDIRVLAVLALQRSQVPVNMFAFRIYTLSYSNFISVIRLSYSFFAVIY